MSTEREALDRLRVPAGLCETCGFLRLLASPRSVFVFCGRAEVDPRFPRYPPLPVARCAGYVEKDTKDSKDSKD
jgi:hypothetical protein